MRELDVAALVASLVSERTVDIITRGRRSGLARTTEIWTTLVDGTLYVCGTPAAGPDGMAAEPRDWLANLLVNPTFTLRLKRPVVVDLPAVATPVTDRAERLRLFQAPQSRYYRDHSLSAGQFVAHAPVVRVELVDDAAPVSAALLAGRASGSS